MHGTRTRGLPCPLGISLALGLLSSNLCFAADPSPKEQARRLFDEGMQAIGKRDRNVGCAKLRESLALFAVPNTLFNVADCDEHDGNFALAHAHWERGLALISESDPRANAAKKRIEALEGKIARLNLVVPPTVGTVTVLFDGEEIPQEAFKAPRVVNVGKHVVITRARGHEDDRREVELAPRDRTEVVLRVGKRKENVDDPEKPGPGPNWKTASFVAFGFGAAGAIAAGITGGLLLSRDTEIKKHCNGFECDQTGFDLAQGQNPLLVGNAIAWGVGAAGLGTGALFFLLHKRTPKNDSARLMPTITNHFVGFNAMGNF